MSLPALHDFVSGFPKGILLLELLFAIIAQPLAHAADNPAPSCPGIAESNEFSNNLKRRLPLKYKLCDRNGELQNELLNPIGRKLNVCVGISGVVGGSFSIEPVTKLSERYSSVCRRYRYFVEKSARICSSYGEVKKFAPAVAGDVNGVEAMKKVRSAYGRLACGYGMLERDAASAANVRSFDGRTEMSPTDAEFTRNKNTIVAMISALPAAVDKSNASAPGKIDPGRIAALKRAMESCQSAGKDLEAFDRIFQKQIFSEIVKMGKEAEDARNYFVEKKNSAFGMQQQLGSRMGGLGTAGADNPGGPVEPIRIRPATPGSADPIVTQCPAEDELTPVEQNLRKSVLYAEKSNGEIGTTFRATTMGPDGKPIHHEVTAGHVVLEDLHNPSNDRLADLKGAPAGQKINPAEAKAFENTPATLDRAHDVAVAPSGIGPGLPVKADDVNPKPGQEFTLAGHPVEGYDSNYVNMSCTFMGYGAGAQSGYYVMDCPTANASAGGMSGGPMVDPKTGYVWGVATNQGGTYDNQDRLLYRDNRIFVSPIQQGADGRIVTGPQRYDSGYCYFVEGTVPHRCYVTPMGVTYE